MNDMFKRAISTLWYCLLCYDGLTHLHDLVFGPNPGLASKL